MLTFILFFLFAGILLVALHFTRELDTGMGVFAIATYLSRMVLYLVTRNVTFFAHGMGGDARVYEDLSLVIANEWSLHGVRFLTVYDNPNIGAASLPPNMFAAIAYMNGGETAPVACTALVAVATALSALNFFKLAIELGATRRRSMLMTAMVFASPGLVFYTSDMYKDGLVLAFVLGAVGSATRLSRRFSVPHLVVGLCCLVALWFVRYYMVFLSMFPILVGYMGFGAKGWTRPLLSLVLFVVVFGLYVRSDMGREMATTVDDTFSNATTYGVEGNTYGGSGVKLGLGIGAMPARVLYTLFSPFPWQGGTMGLQLGKIDTLMFSYLIYRAFLASRKLVKSEKSTLMGLAAFIVPTTIAYAMTFANIGLILRQRIPLVAVMALLAVLSWPTRSEIAAAVKRAALKKAHAGKGATSARPPRLSGGVGALAAAGATKK